MVKLVNHNQKNFSEKTSKKGLTNEKKCDILNKSPHERDDKKSQKTFEKTSEKGLTNKRKCDIIDKRFREKASEI